MSRTTSVGKCGLCGGTYGKSSMARHLQSCLQAAREVPPRQEGWRKTKVFHLVVEGRYLPQYWLHLLVPADATLATLDTYLRDIWLECCGHLSAFTLEGTHYISHDARELDGRSMAVALGKALRPGLKFQHEYDFGSTTYLALRVVSEGEGQVQGRAIRLLARNEPPVAKCSCGKPATQVIASYSPDDDSWYCDECIEADEDGEEGFLPVVNSPRIGVCGYAG